jgi:hypothetical protein
LKQVQPGFTQPEQILTLHVSIPDAQAPKPEQAFRTYNNILEKIAAIPGVAPSAGLTNSITMDGNNDNDPIFAADKTYANRKYRPAALQVHFARLFQSHGQPAAGRPRSDLDRYLRNPPGGSGFREPGAGTVARSQPPRSASKVRENPKANGARSSAWWGMSATTASIRRPTPSCTGPC